MNILVIGGLYENNPEIKEKTSKFIKKLSKQIVKNGHTLLNACLTEFDAELAKHATKELKKRDERPRDRIIGYIIDGMEPIHTHGKIRHSELKDWNLGGPDLKIPEPVELADVVIAVCGFDGTQKAANWARIANKPLLPLVKFGGAAKAIYAEERKKYDNSGSHHISLDDFENLAETSVSDEELAADVINIAERIKVSNDAFVIMSFTDDPALIDAYQTFKDVCSEFDPPYDCKRMDEITDNKRITPAMFANIKNSAFVIVELSMERPNVYYEMGYADALDKPMIATAKEGTKIHFDAKDVPIIFWNSQKQLKEDLRLRIQQIASKQGR
ncbi:MAG: hypothetical protein KJP20_11060 [Bacteroidia bacterium]|nr:hypothetical protein [Bacteroidia bacterium]NNK61491.1 hypothetical protein [Flavobacteriaceae bacterium]